MTLKDVSVSEILRPEDGGTSPGLAEAAQIRYLSPDDTVFTLTEGHMLNVKAGARSTPECTCTALFRIRISGSIYRFEPSRMRRSG